MRLFIQTKPVVSKVKQWRCGTGQTGNYLILIPELEIKVRNGFFQSLKKKSHWVRTLAGANEGSLVAPVSSPGSRCWQREVGKGFWGVRAEKQKGGKPSDPGLSKWAALRLLSTGVPSLVEIAGPWKEPALTPKPGVAGAGLGRAHYRIMRAPPGLQRPARPNSIPLLGESLLSLPQIFLDLHLPPSLRKVKVLLTSLCRALQCDKNTFSFSVGGVSSSVQRWLLGIFPGYVINILIKPLPVYEKMVVAILALTSTFPFLIINRNN